MSAKKKATKAATKKPTKEPAKAKEPTKAPPASRVAQSALPVGLSEDALNPRETKVLAHLRSVAPAAETSAQIAARAFPGVRGGEGKAGRARSWARNSLRRLVREGFVVQAGGDRAEDGRRKPGQGTYRAAEKSAEDKAAE